MPRKNQPPLLPARMAVNWERLSQYRFASLVFPYAKALDGYIKRIQDIAKHNGVALEARHYPAWRLLNNAIMACAPGIIYASEGTGVQRNMLAFHNPTLTLDEQYPSVEQLCELITLWLPMWRSNAGLPSLLGNAEQAAWDELQAALDQPETDWLINNAAISPNHPFVYSALPAVLAEMLNGHSTQLSGNTAQKPIRWRKANSGEQKGVYLVSQPYYREYFEEGEDGSATKQSGYFVYRLQFSLQTQAARIEPWIFVKVGMQRFPHLPFKKDVHHRRKNLNVLVGFNRSAMRPDGQKRHQWERDTTLVTLPIHLREKRWADNLADLLNEYSVGELANAEDVLKNPTTFGNLEDRPNWINDEYYLIHAEGRKYGESGQGRNHGVPLGFTLTEFTDLLEQIFAQLDGVLIPDHPFAADDAQMPKKVPFILRSAEWLGNKKRLTLRYSAIHEALQRAVQHTHRPNLDIAIFHTTSHFAERVTQQVRSILGLAEGELLPARLCLHQKVVSLTLHAPLDSGNLNPQDHFNPNRSRDFHKQWSDQMRDSHKAKREAWKAAFEGIAWRPDAHRLAIIESHYKISKAHESQQIKGAVRDAACRAGVLSQFLGSLSSSSTDKLTAPARGRLENAVLDLLIRQTAALYGAPSDLYVQVAKMPPHIARTMDVIAFVRHQTNNPDLKIRYALAVRLRCDGSVDVLLPNQDKRWIPYVEASAVLGRLFSESRSATRKNSRQHALHLSNRQMMQFVSTVLTKRLERPTLAVIKANGWRDARAVGDNDPLWIQLRNSDLPKSRHILDFGRLGKFRRQDEAVSNLLGVVRLRYDAETPQYTTTTMWSVDGVTIEDVPNLSGYVDDSVAELTHYFSVAGVSKLQRRQKARKHRFVYKMTQHEALAFRHAQLVEMVPFFVHPDLQSREYQCALCRCIHFLRVAPAFKSGEVLLPYPMHLGEALIEDLLCIVGLD